MRLIPYRLRYRTDFFNNSNSTTRRRFWFTGGAVVWPAKGGGKSKDDHPAKIARRYKAGDGRKVCKLDTPILIVAWGSTCGQIIWVTIVLIMGRWK